MMKIFRIIVAPIYLALLLCTLVFAIPFFFIDKDVYNGKFGRNFVAGVRGDEIEEEE